MHKEKRTVQYGGCSYEHSERNTGNVYAYQRVVAASLASSRSGRDVVAMLLVYMVRHFSDLQHPVMRCELDVGCFLMTSAAKHASSN